MKTACSTLSPSVTAAAIGGSGGEAVFKISRSLRRLKILSLDDCNRNLSRSSGRTANGPLAIDSSYVLSAKLTSAKNRSLKASKDGISDGALPARTDSSTALLHFLS